MNNSPLSSYVSPQGLAALLNVHLRTIYRWLANGTVDSTKVGGRRMIHKEQTLKKLGLL